MPHIVARITSTNGEPFRDGLPYQHNLTAARNEVDARVKQARKELTEYAGDLATSRAQALLEQSMTEADRKHFFAESVKRVEESQS